MNQRDTTYAKWFALVGGAFLIAAATLEYWPTSNNLPWLSLEEARGIAASQNKPIFVDVYAEWCGPCKLMEKIVFPDDSVQSTLKGKFVLAKINGDDPVFGDTLKKQFHIRGYPTYLVLSPAGRERKRHVGFFPKSQLLTWLKDSTGVMILQWPGFDRALSVAEVRKKRLLVLVLQSFEQIEPLNDLFEEKVVKDMVAKYYIPTLIMRGNVGDDALLKNINASTRSGRPEIIVLGDKKKEFGRFFVTEQMHFGLSGFSARLIELATN